MSELELRWLSVPYIFQAFSLLVLGGFAALTRGDRLIRASLLFLVVAVMPYTVGIALVGGVDDPQLARKFMLVAVGSVSMVGVALMMLLLTTSGVFEAHRKLFGFALLCSAATAVVTWTTDLVVGEMWKTSWGLWYNTSGPLNDALSSQFVIWTGVGIVLTRRTRQPLTERQRSQVKLLAVGLTIALLAVTDSLLVRRIGVYPFSFIPACIGIWAAIIACARHDLLRSRGFDWASLYEIVAVLGLAGGVAGFLWLTRNDETLSSPAVSTALLVPALLAAYVFATVVRTSMTAKWRAREARTGEALDRFIEQASHARDEAALSDSLNDLLVKDLQLGSLRVYLQVESGLWTTIGGDTVPPLSLDARVRAWLLTNRKPLVRDELLTQRLGGLRKPIESFMALIDADLVVPMVDREQLVGLIASGGRADQRALRDSEKTELLQAASASGRAVTYIRLVRDARQRIEVVKEVEVAAAVQRARAPGEQSVSYGQTEIISHYLPAYQFGGNWWMSHELPDGRVLMVIGDVTGHGVSSALISFTVEGACETAYRMLGDGFDVLALLQLLNQAVLDVGKGMYAMSCFVAVVDPGERTVTFANAGHPFPYLCRHSETAKRGNAELTALVSRGTPLGAADPVFAVSTLPLEADDVLVFFSESITSSRNPEGQAYGDRRFQRVLRNKVRPAGRGACSAIISDAQTFYGNQSITEDINLVVLRLAAG